MAAGSAHIASTAQLRPSIFDLDAQNDLKELLKPITRNFVQWLSQKAPEFRTVLNHPTALSFLVSVLVESYYLKKHGATFSEAFYGLKRCERGKDVLSGGSVAKTLATEEVLPFLLNVFNNISEKLLYERLSGRNNEITGAVIKLNTTIQRTFQVLNFAQRLRYITGQTEHHSPLIWLSGLTLTYAEPVDSSFSWRDFLPTAVQRSFEVGVFLLQCYHWWQTESHGILGQLPSPPPPQPPYNAVCYEGVCPICLEPRKIDTVLSVSGFVFCFACIQQYMAQNRKCPVTQIPATIHDLIRIYPEDT